jgi:hypothetical protein
MSWVRVPEGWYDPTTNTLVRPPAGYNPSQYAPEELARQLASYLGGQAQQEKVVSGPIAPPPAWQIEVAGASLNAGLVAELYAKYPKDVADAIIRDNLAIEGVTWTPPASAPPDVKLGISTTAVVGPQPQRAGEPAMTVQPGSARTDIRGGEPLRDLATQLSARARELYQTDRLGWDGWARVYREVTGETPPAPEDRGLRRGSDGSVAIAGATRYDLATWARAAGIELGPLAGGLSMPEIAARVKALAREAGSDRWGWDQWNWFYREVTGADAPAPEDRGFQRTSTGAVLIGGVETYPYETWAAHALGQITTVVDDGRGEPPPPPPPGRSMLGWLVLGGVLLLVVLRR